MHRRVYVMTRILIIITLFHSALCIHIPAPVNLSISSQYFVHLLSWKMGPGSPDGVHYKVSMCTLSETPMVVKGCEKVTYPLSCNLTEVFSDLEETYYTSVSAGMGNWTSLPAHCSPFKPIQNTTLEPPLVTVSACNKSLCVSLKAPAPKLHHIYNSFRFHYRLVISSEDGPEFHEDTEGLQNVTLKDLAPGRRYCVTVKIIDRSHPNRPPACASTPKTANSSETLISFVLCLVILLLLMTVIPRLVSHFYLKADLPAVLSSFHSPYKRKHLLITSADSINTLSEDTDFLQKMKRNREEHEEIETETDEGVMYEKLLTCFEDKSQTSSSSIVPSSSSCGLLMDQSSHTGLTSSTDVQGCSLSLHEGSWVPETESVASTEVTLNVKHFSWRSVSLTRVEQEDSGTTEVESDTDVNLFSVTLGGITSERHEADADQTRCITDELDPTDLSPQSPFESATASLWLSDFKPLNSETLEMHISDSEEEDDEYSGYLSRT
ncbi:cytokine receptor family member b2 isoform X2 [Myxocyprinus asiaticus]|uniref:cytokine receptor family member b2 isoform X2 n=1 Tax=Myxocyprinus asiaticus TaxID=70543 RepID=UPI002223635D|nr:cytokine receptor family member b2 isoform X2 [Myxocyprinus asiaticus]